VIAAPLLHDTGAVTPEHFWTAWTFEPLVILGLGASAVVYAIGSHRLRARVPDHYPLEGWQAASFWAGWMVLALALLSPLHVLGETLFSAHMAQHELLMVVAAPLLVLGRPLVPGLWALSPPNRQIVGSISRITWLRRGWSVATRLDVATALQIFVVLVWHAPTLYQESVRFESVHALQHTAFLGSALLFWWAVFHGTRARLRYGAAVLCLFLTTLVTGGLGALLTVAPHPLYPVYSAGPRAWGFTPLEDQQLAGLIMWIPGGLTYLVAALALTKAWLTESDRRVRRWENTGWMLPLIVLIMSGAALSGCSSKADKAEKAAKQVSSWRKTIQLVEQNRARGALPEVYARQMLQAARQELRKQGQ
jgi:cytochrome c oxidase assembly factor CtaG